MHRQRRTVFEAVGKLKGFGEGLSLNLSVDVLVPKCGVRLQTSFIFPASQNRIEKWAVYVYGQELDGLVLQGCIKALARRNSTKIMYSVKNLSLRLGLLLAGPVVLSTALSTRANAIPLNTVPQISIQNRELKPLESTSEVKPLLSQRPLEFQAATNSLISPKSIETTSPTKVTFTSDPSIKASLSSSPQKSSVETPRIAQPAIEPEPEASRVPRKEAEFIMPPRTASKKKLNPFTTTLILNGKPISHLTNWELATGTDFGEDRSTNLNLNGTVKIDSKVTESLTRNNVYKVDQTGSYLQLRTVQHARTISVNRKEPQTLTGLRIQLSLTGSCILPGGNSDRQCTYTPGIFTDNSSINSDFLVPTRIFQLSNVGDVVTPESLAIIQLPGFQSGANGQNIGLDLYFPNAGALPKDPQSNPTTVSRTEDVENTTAATYSRVHQIVKANDRKAVIGRTIHGFTAIPEDKNTLLNSALQLGTQLFPDVDPPLKGSSQSVNPNVNNNLFLAANNTRIPDNSFTVYQAGMGQADSLKTSANKLSDVPAATFNSFWLGLSPITERSYSTGVRYETTGPQKALASSGAEGGTGSNNSFTSVVNADTISTSQLQNFYTQIYLSFYNQDANLVTTSKLVEKTHYFPHFGFTGNITRSQDVLRYYAGAIISDTPKVYLGLDYTKKTQNGWTFAAGGIGYLNPDRDYYSQVQGSISKKIALGKAKNLFLATGFNYAIDRETQIGNTTIISPASSVTVSASTQLGPVTFGVVQYFGGILPNSVRNMLVTNLELKLSDSVRLSAYATPISENADRSLLGISAQFRLGRQYNSPTLSLSWSNNEYNFGVDSIGRELRTSNNVFSLTFKMGDPPNPFDAERAKRLTEQLDRESQEYLNKRNKALQNTDSF
jgi:hypothetical protein